MRRMHSEAPAIWEDDVYVNGRNLGVIARLRHLELKVDGDLTLLHPGVARLNVKIPDQLKGEAADIGVQWRFRH